MKKLIAFSALACIVFCGCGKNPMFSMLPAVVSSGGSGSSGSTGTVNTSYQSAKARILPLVSDAYLDGLTGSMDGTSGRGSWSFMFYSPSKVKKYAISVDQNGTSSTPVTYSASASSSVDTYHLDAYNFSATDSDQWCKDITAVNAAFGAGTLTSSSSSYGGTGGFALHFTSSTVPSKGYDVNLLLSYSISVWY